MKNPRIPIILLLVLIAALPASAQQYRRDNDPLTDRVSNGKGIVNFNTGVVRAKGYGAPSREAGSPSEAKLMALGAARTDALRTLAMSVSSIQVTASTTVKNYVLKNDLVQTSLSAMLQSASVVSEDFQRDGTAVVVVEIPMYGDNSVASCVFPEIYGKGRRGRKARVEPEQEEDTNRGSVFLSAPAPAPVFKGPDQPAVRIERVPSGSRYNDTLASGARGANAVLRLTPNEDNGAFSSVIVDCRGIGINAIMSPKLMDTSGREVYGTVRVTPEYAIETGIVSYPRSAAQALKVPRAGDHPLVIRALRAADKNSFNPVISLEDADRVLAANNRDHFLERTAVIFLVDPVR